MAFCSSHAAPISAARLGAQAVHLAQPLGRLLDHPQGVEAEVVDDALGGLGADPLD